MNRRECTIRISIGSTSGEWVMIPVVEKTDHLENVNNITFNKSELFITSEAIHILRNLQCRATKKNLKRLLKQGYSHTHDKHFIPSEYKWIQIRVDDEFNYSMSKKDVPEIKWGKKDKSWKIIK